MSRADNNSTPADETGGPADGLATATLERLDRMESMLASLLARETVKAFYSTDEFARAVSKAEFTVREWCRLGRIKAEKKRTGRGMHKAWVVSHEELERYRREGLLPQRH